jgi:hypothetical protein
MAFSTIGLLQSWPKYQPPPTFTAIFKGAPLTPSTQNGYDILILDSSGTLTLTIPGTKNISYYVIGGGGGGGRGGVSTSLYRGFPGNGGNGGVSKTGSFTVNNVINGTYSISIGNGGIAGNAGAASSIRGPGLDVSCNGGIVGKTGATGLSTFANSKVTGSAKGGIGSALEYGTAGPGENGVNTFIPHGKTYGGAGGGGGRPAGGGNAGFNSGPGGNAGGGNGSRTTTDASPGSEYGAGGGGGCGTRYDTGASTTSGLGGAGFQGVVFLYWDSNSF